MSRLDAPLCPRCGERVGQADDDESAEMVAKMCEWDGGCKYEPCDDLACRALKDPQTLEQHNDALLHWKTHTYLSGCSHGR